MREKTSYEKCVNWQPSDLIGCILAPHYLRSAEMSFLHTVCIVIGLLAVVFNVLVVFRNYFPAKLYDALTFGYGMSKTATTLPLRVPKWLVDIKFMH